MDAFSLLSSRKSHNKLTAPAPSEYQLEQLFKVALRAPDHALLKPWRYRVFQGESLLKLGEWFVTASLDKEPELSVEKIERIRQKSLRAPMVIVASVSIVEHPKVPEIEQVLSGGASVQNLLMAAHFLGIGAMWRTGGLIFSEHLKASLGLANNEKIIGFIYLGTEDGEKREAREVNWQDFVTLNQ